MLILQSIGTGFISFISTDTSRFFFLILQYKTSVLFHVIFKNEWSKS